MQDNLPMRSRSVEMFLGIVTVMMGITFVFFGGNMTNPVYVYVKEWTVDNEMALGLLLMFCGTSRVAALLVNGYWRRTPIARLIGAAVCAGFWGLLCSAYFHAPILGAPIGLAWPLTAMAFETFAAMRSAQDAWAADSFGLRHRASLTRRA
jgi:hypothetical protein